MKPTAGSKSGFSTFEIIIAIGLSAIIVLAVGKFSDAITSMGVLINNELRADQDLELSFRVIRTELRSMGPSEAGAYPLEVVSTSTIIFYSDIDSDGLTEKVKYKFGTSTFEKGVIEPTINPVTYPTSTENIILVAPSIISASSSFLYYGEGYTGSEAPLSSPIQISSVRIIGVRLVAEVSTSTAPRPIGLEDIITIRNLRNQ